MKTIFATAALLAVTTTAHAGGLSDPIVPVAAQPQLDLSEYNGGLVNRVMCSNVPAQSGSVPGVFISAIGYVVEAPYADSVTVDLAGVLPAGVSSKDPEELTWALDNAGLPRHALVTRPDERIVVEEEEVVKERLVADGSTPSGDNLTSMGDAASDGATIMRARSTIEQDVEIWKAGQGVVDTITVGVGDTLVPVDGPGTYKFTFLGTHTVKTKATGPQTFDDIDTILVEDKRTTSGRWCG